MCVCVCGGGGGGGGAVNRICVLVNRIGVIKLMTCSTEMAIFAQCLVMYDTLHCHQAYVLCGYMYYAIIIIII